MLDESLEEVDEIMKSADKDGSGVIDVLHFYYY